MLLAWLTKLWLFHFLVLVLTLLSNSIVNHHKTIPYLSSPCHLGFHRLLSRRSLSISFISRCSTLPVFIQKPFTHFWSACQAFSVSFIWSPYSIQDAGVLWIYTASQFTVWFFIPFLISSTNLFSFDHGNPQNWCFHPTGQPFALFNWFPLLIACQSSALTVLCTVRHVTLHHLLCGFLDCCLKHYLNKMFIFLDQ